MCTSPEVPRVRPDEGGTHLPRRPVAMSVGGSGCFRANAASSGLLGFSVRHQLPWAAARSLYYLLA